MSLIATSSSWREKSLHSTLRRIKKISHQIGITRVTDVTRLDKIGLPVFCSIRPGATKGSLCVNAGKGLLSLEAEVGAYMEAFEYAMAEFNSTRFSIDISTPRRITNQKTFKSNFLDLCPVWNSRILPDAPIEVVTFKDINSSNLVQLPAELAFSPIISTRGQQLFGCSTNGLSSGNTMREAIIHGVFEVIERDIQAFNFFQENSYLVTNDSLPENLKLLVKNIESAGFKFFLRYTENLFGLPYFQAFIDENKFVPIAISHGTGVHMSSSIAAVRAITEAAQSRLSYIHGGRDDLIDRYNYFVKQNPKVERESIERLRLSIAQKKRIIKFEEIPTLKYEDINEVLEFIKRKLHSCGFSQILTFELSPPRLDLKAVKVVIPRMESFNPKLKRIGPRLVDHIKSIT